MARELTPPVQVLVVDDHPLVCRALLQVLEGASAPPVHVVGCVHDAAEASTALRQLRPDVALIDLGMPAPGGLSVLSSARGALPDVRLLAMADDGDAAVAAAAVAAGADGVVSKSAEPDLLLAPLLAVAAGWMVLPHDAMAELRRPPAPQLPQDLTEQERMLLRGIALGSPNVELSRRLLVSERTTKRLVGALLRKLQVSNRAAAAALAGRAGLLDGLPESGDATR